MAYAGAFESDEKPTADKPSAGQSQVAADDLTTEELADMPDEELVDNVSYYKEISASKDQIVQRNQKAVYIVKQKTPQPSTKPDLDNKKYRDQVTGSALDLNDLNPEEQKAVADYAKEVSQYENKLINKRIRELVEKAKTKGLTKAERMELINLLPIKNPGPELKLEPPSGEKNPGKQQPKDKEQPKDPSEDSKNQDIEQPGNPSEDNENQDKEQPGNPSEDNENQDKEQPGNPSEDNENQDKEQPGNPSEDNENQDKEQPGNPSEDNENQDKEQPGTPTDGSDSDNNQEPPEKEQPDPTTPALTTEKNGYNRQKAVDYAYKWWNGRNPAYRSYELDCTNFISQVVKAGGIKERKGSRWDWADYWYYDSKQPSMTWTVAHSFYRHMKLTRQAVNESSSSKVKVGDIISVDFEDDGRMNHSVIITKIKNGKIYATYHTTDRKDYDITYWFTFYKVYSWKMGTVKN